MARQSKPTPRIKRDGSPNIILVILAVMFFLSNLVLGIWGYFGYEGQETIRKAALKEKEKFESAQNTRDYQTFVAMEMRVILGDELSQDEATNYQALRPIVLDDNGKYKDQPSREAVLKLMQKAKDDFGWDDKAGKYASSAKVRINELTATTERLKGIVNEKDKKLAAAADVEQKAVDKSANFYRDLLAQVKAGSKSSLEASRQGTAEMKEMFNRNLQLRDEITALNDKRSFEDSEFAVRLNSLTEDLSRAKESIQKLKEGGAGQAMAQGKAGKGAIAERGNHPLMLDVSTGRTLWDRPVGRILRVIGTDKVEIVLFSGEKLLRPKLTFNVFARLWKDDGKQPPATANSRAEGELKGTLEVMSVEASKSAICRVTARFDAKNPPNVDDLIYNMFFGSHVAVAGQVNLFGKSRGDSPGEEDRNLKRFLANLEDQGVVVDAYVDLVDGIVKGKFGSFGPRTDFLIRGDLLNAKAAALQAGDGKINVAEINTAIENLQKEAEKRGAFIISPENFANVAGLRKIGGYGPDEIPFLPRLPSASP